MALFNVSVLATLHLPEWLRQTILKLVVTQDRAASAAERHAAALEALLAKINEPPAEESVLQAQVDEMARRLKEANDKLEQASPPPTKEP